MMEEGRQLWKAIGFGLAGIPLGFAIGGSLAAVIAATVLVSVAGAVNWGRHMCEPRSRGVPVRAYAAVAGAGVLVIAVHAVLPFLLPVVAVLAVLAVACVPVLRKARRLCVPRSSAFHARYQKIAAPVRHPARPPRLRGTAQTALPAGSSLRAIEAPRPAVQGVIIKTAERTGHAQ